MKISNKAKKAILEAIKRNAPVSDLDMVGVSPRTTSILEDMGITTIKELISLTKQEIRQRAIVTGHKVVIGPVAIDNIITGLHNFHLFDIEVNKFYNNLNERKQLVLPVR